MCFGAILAEAQQQLPVYSLGIGGSTQSSGSQSSSSDCSPSDPSCGTGNNQMMMQQGMQQGANAANTARGIVLDTQQMGQQNNQQQLNLQQQAQGNQQNPLPLDPPTEFQQLVANSTGKMLPIYGSQMFRTLPSTFAPVNQIPVTPDYVVGPNDELLIQTWGQVTLNSRFVVDRSGAIYIPQLGTVHVAGMRFDQLQPFLKSQMGKNFRNFDLNVNMGHLRSIEVYITGQARKPGNWTLSSLSTLVTAVFATGGPSPAGSMRDIQLRRGGKLITEFDLYDLILYGDKSKDVALLPGDVIYIPPVGPQVAMAGSVKMPAIYELKHGASTTVGEALDLAAGMTNVASGDKLRLERVDQRHLRSIIEVSLDAQGKSVALQDGDLLELVAIPSQFKDAVTLRGNVANPGRYTWKPGMHVLDLLPNKEALITRDYWLKRSQMGQPTMSYVPTCLPTTPYGIPSLRYGIPVGEESDDPYWKYSSMRSSGLGGLVGMPVINGGPWQGQVLTGDGMYTYPQMTPFNQLMNGGDSQPTDGGLDCSRLQDMQSYIPANTIGGNPQGAANQQQGSQQNSQSSQQNNNAGLANASVGSTNTNNSAAALFLPKNDVRMSEPDIDWAYAVIERQNKENLSTALFPFNLGKAVLEGDASQNLDLMPGDVVTIFSKADIKVPQTQQTRFVRLEGEVVSSGIYSVRPGETLRQLVQRAGGLTQDAYLYGAEFTRESTRRVQQQRFNEYVDQISLQVSTNAQNSASRAISSTDATALAAQQQTTQNIISSLRRVRATGRIVLELAPGATSLDTLPDLTLEDGDKLIIPKVPSTVSVDGAVYNQNSFLYDPHRRLGDYVHMAGGANRDADRNRAFVLRAGGDVVSRQYSSSLRGHGFDSVRLYPGDTVVIPLNLDKGKTMRMVVDLAQIVGQFGIAVAAMNTVLGN
ncbi:MAG: SLBB domain-containing protein [Edaphobacter sp.]|uniref:SLBB domain-containing protein n=1 Tax=Edaphobacter sp. TaxID=1934404 RepID=UPI0023A61E04|nr:SLBB domain-containing protein [Edaphobacter sp.]MDE1176997.1 SLBB domain-containing protein [Edaphobacter sp.]